MVKNLRNKLKKNYYLKNLFPTKPMQIFQLLLNI